MTERESKDEKKVLAGRVSGEMRRRKQLLRVSMETLLSSTIRDETGAEALAKAVFSSALQGNEMALEFIMWILRPRIRSGETL